MEQEWTTARTRLRALTVGDAQRVYQMTSSEEVTAYMRFDAQKTLEQAQELIKEYIQPKNLGFAVIEKRSERLIGVFALKWEEEGVYAMSAFYEAAVWGKGYGTEVQRFFCERGKAWFTVQKLRAYVVGMNTGSCRVLEKNGFFVARRLIFDDLPSGLLIYEREL